MKYFIILMLFLPEVHAVGLKRAPEMIAKQVAKKLAQAQGELGPSTKATYIYKNENEDETAYYLKRLRLQYAPFVAFDLAFFEMKIVPFIEFRWIRKNPVGWINYRRVD